jgi:hypothetical protein
VMRKNRRRKFQYFYGMFVFRSHGSVTVVGLLFPQVFSTSVKYPKAISALNEITMVGYDNLVNVPLLLVSRYERIHIESLLYKFYFRVIRLDTLETLLDTTGIQTETSANHAVSDATGSQFYFGR